MREFIANSGSTALVVLNNSTAKPVIRAALNVPQIWHFQNMLPLNAAFPMKI
jgi:hypothetical protein